MTSTQDLYPATLELDAGPIRALDLALFAAASGDHNPLHLDDAVAQIAGFERPVVHGMLSMALAGRLFTQHFGVASVQQLNTRFTGVAQRGQTLSFKAELDHVEDGLGHYRLTARNGDGLDILTGTARVKAPAPARP
jgi:acyl dehydratase